MAAWSNTWDRIRATQAKQRAEAAAAELREADPRPIPEHLPPLPPGTRYGGVLDDYEGPADGFVCDPTDGLGWGYKGHWVGMKGCARMGCPDNEWPGLWHVAIPIDEQP